MEDVGALRRRRVAGIDSGLFAGERRCPEWTHYLYWPERVHQGTGWSDSCKPEREDRHARDEQRACPRGERRLCELECREPHAGKCTAPPRARGVLRHGTAMTMGDQPTGPLHAVYEVSRRMRP